jgi:hypothetical protein
MPPLISGIGRHYGHHKKDDRTIMLMQNSCIDLRPDTDLQKRRRSTLPGPAAGISGAAALDQHIVAMQSSALRKLHCGLICHIRRRR